MAEKPSAHNQELSMNRVYPIADAVAKSMALASSLSETDPVTRSRKKRLCLPTCFSNIDRHIGGLWPGELTIVTGGPGVGKSTFALNIATLMALKGVRVLLFSQEWNATATALRMLASLGRADIAKLLCGDVHEKYLTSLVDAANQLSETDLYICDDPDITLEALCNIARLTAEGAEKMLVVIDSLSSVMRLDDDRPFNMDPLCMPLKQLALQINAPVLATASCVSYGIGYPSRDYKQILAALPCGVQNVADSVLYINRPLASAEPDGIPSMNVAEITIAKHHLCAPTTVKLAFADWYLRFMDYVGDPRNS